MGNYLVNVQETFDRWYMVKASSEKDAKAKVDRKRNKKEGDHYEPFRKESRLALAGG